jgi:hypothetical protein
MTATSTGPSLGPTTPYYGGRQVSDPANVIKVTGTPSSKAIHNNLGTIAIENSASSAWILTSKTGGVATWTLVGSGTGPIDTLTLTGAGDSGGPVTASGGNVNLAGGTGIDLVGTTNTVTANVVGGGLKTVAVTGATNVATNTSYINANATGSTSVTFTLQATGYALGDIVEVVGLSTDNSGGAYWIIQANTGATFHSGATSGASGGTLTGTQRYSAVQIKAAAITTGAVTDWVVLNQSGTVAIA